MKRCSGSSSKKRLTRSMADEPINVDDDDSVFELMQRRDEVRRGKSVREEPADEEMVEGYESLGEGDDDDDVDDYDDEPQTVSYKEAMLNFKLMKVGGTRYMHRATITKLGIIKDVDYMLQSSSLTQFVLMPQESYPKETIQFLATVTLTEYSSKQERLKRIGGFGELTFEVNHKRCSFTSTQFEELFELPTCRGLDVDYDRQELNHLWKVMAGPEPYDPRSSKCSSIRNPAIRYFHRAIANTCFARNESGYVRLSEIQMIDEALVEILNANGNYGMTFRGEATGVGFTKALMKHLTTYRGWSSRLSDKSRGVIRIGGIVTRILEACNVPLKSKSVPPAWIDAAYLQQIHFLARTPQGATWLYKFSHLETGKEMMMRLPNEEYTPIGQRGNIAFLPPEDILLGKRTREDSREQIQEPTEEADQAPACFYFDEYTQPRMSKGMAVAHKNLGLVQRFCKWTAKGLTSLEAQFKDLKLSLNSRRGRDLTPPDFRGPTPPPPRRSTSTMLELRRRSLSEQPRRASSHTPRPMPLEQQHDSAPRSYHFDLNSTTLLEPTAALPEEQYNYVVERTPELHPEQSPELPLQRRPLTRTRRSRSRSTVRQQEEAEPQQTFQPQSFYPQTFQPNAEVNFLDPLGSTSSVFNYTLPLEQQQEPQPHDDSMDVDPSDWSIFG